MIEEQDIEDQPESEDDQEIQEKPVQDPQFVLLKTKEINYYKRVEKYLRTCDKIKIQQMVDIINCKHNISLRILDWVVTRYSKTNVEYSIDSKNDIDNADVFDISISYRAQLRTFKKRYFDPFRRRQKFNYYYDTDDRDKKVVTTLGQLHFFRWAFSHDIIKFVETNIDDILEAMNTCNKEDQKKKLKKQQQQKKLEEKSILSQNKDQNSNKSSGDSKKDSKKDKINVHITEIIENDEQKIILDFD
jgi:hypothetical protein